MRKAAEEPEPHDTAVDNHNAMSEVPLGKIQSLVCQVMVLSDARRVNWSSLVRAAQGG